MHIKKAKKLSRVVLEVRESDGFFQENDGALFVCLKIDFSTFLASKYVKL